MNECRFQGHISGCAEERTLPSGDVIVVFRLVVPRPDGGRHDTIDCAASTKALRARLLAMPEAMQLEVEGAMHRRFYRTPHGIASRYELAVRSIKRLPAPSAEGKGAQPRGARASLA